VVQEIPAEWLPVRCEVLLFWAMTLLKMVTDISEEDTDTRFREAKFSSETVVPTYKIITLSQTRKPHLSENLKYEYV
jgi:hypothetical protein